MYCRMFFMIVVGLLLSGESLHAEVITIDGTIKSVDAAKRTITVETEGEAKTFDVSSKVKVSVEGKDAGLDALKEGQKVKLSYHDELEIVLKIEVGNHGKQDELNGEWIFVEGVAAGNPIDGPLADKRRIVIKENKYTLFFGDKTILGELKLDRTESPKHLDWIPKTGGSQEFAGKLQRGIYELNKDGTILRFCVGKPEDERPTEYDGTPKGWSVQTYEKRSKVPGPSKVPMLVELTELNFGNYTGDPWLSQDGLNIYWVSEDEWIWTASRRESRSLFQNKERIVKGTMPTVSSDGLELIFAGPSIDGQRGGSLYVARRQSADSLFGRPEPIREANQIDFPRNPCLSDDGLVLYLSMARDASIIQQKDSSSRDRENNWIFGTLTRKDRGSAWSPAKPLKVEKEGIDGKLTWLYLSSDALAMLCAREGRSEQRELEEGMIMLWTRESVKEPFSRSKHIRIDGLPTLVGRSPRYCAVTQQLVFARAMGNNKLALWTITNLSLPEFSAGK